MKGGIAGNIGSCISYADECRDVHVLVVGEGASGIRRVCIVYFRREIFASFFSTDVPRKPRAVKTHVRDFAVSILVNRDRTCTNDWRKTVIQCSRAQCLNDRQQPRRRYHHRRSYTRGQKRFLPATGHRPK